MSRPRGPGRLIVAAFVLVPLVELALAIMVGRWIGAVPTILLLLVESLFGAWLIRREGAAAYRALVESTRTGVLPSSQRVADAALILLGGALLLTPGFLTDAVGFLFVIPPTRPMARRALLALVRRYAGRGLGAADYTSRVIITSEVISEPPGGPSRTPGPAVPGTTPPDRPASPQVIEGTVLDD